MTCTRNCRYVQLVQSEGVLATSCTSREALSICVRYSSALSAGPYPETARRFPVASYTVIETVAPAPATIGEGEDAPSSADASVAGPAATTVVTTLAASPVAAPP